MTTPDPTLAARLAELDNNLRLAQAQVGGAGWAKECASLSAALLSAFCADQLITTAEADARVKAAVLAEREAIAAFVETHAYTVGNERKMEPSKQAINDMHHATIAAAIRSRGVTG